MEIILFNVCKYYHDKKIINGLNYKIKDKTFVTFFGKSGSGKTTLLNVIGTLDSLTSGKIEYILKGNNISSVNQIRRNIGFIFQNYALIETKSVRDNLRMGVELKKWNKKELEARMLQTLKYVNLDNILDKNVYELSGGEQQRISIARAILRDVDTIIADEPTGNLDDENAQIIVDLLKKLNDDGKTIIVVSHDVKFKDISKEVINLY